MDMNLDDTREHLARVVPWPEGDAPGYVNIHWTSMKPGRDKPIWAGRGCKTIEAAARVVKWAGGLNDTTALYVCMSLQSTCEEKISSKGNKYLSAVRSQQNALALKSFYLDLDYKQYDSPQEAVTALGNFLKKSGMPEPSLIVKSGGGLHIYWTLVEAITPAEWTPWAFALVELTKKFNLKCDTQVTVDAARVLRVAGMQNLKEATPRPVEIGLRGGDYLLERIAKALEPYRTQALPVLPPRPPIQGVSDLAAGIESEASAPIDMRTLVPECGFLRDALTTAGKNYSNPLWNLTTLCSTFMEDGRLIAHLMARGHSGYTRESTDALYARKEKEKAEKSLGWPSCRTISASGATQCATCPHFNEGKSPLHFGRRKPPPLPPGLGPGIMVDDLPGGYVRDQLGKVYKLTALPDGSMGRQPLADYPMYAPWIQKDPWQFNFTSVIAKRPVQIGVPTGVVGGREMRKALQEQGFMLRDPDPKHITEFVVSWMKTLENTKNAVVSSAPFGWIDNERGQLEGFAYDGHVWNPGEPRLAPNPDPVLARQYRPHGVHDPWTEAAKLITSQGRPGLDAILAASFGAPLVRFTNQFGVLMSAFSQESGIGKSTAMRVAQAVWGDPVKAVSMLNDTSNSVLNKMGAIRSLPMFWDELKTEEETRRFISLAFNLGQGKEKSRLRADASQRELGTWQTILVVASNDSLLDKVVSRTKTTTAGLYRVFEYTVDPPGEQGQIAPSDASRIVGRLNNNFGQIGRDYAQFLGAEFDRIEQEVGDFHRELDAEVSAATEERFWTAVIASVCMGARYAKERGYCEIDEEALKAFMLATLADLRGERQRSTVDFKQAFNVSNVLAQYLNAMATRHTLVTNRIWMGRGRPAPGTIKPMRDTNKLDAIYVRIGLEDKLIRISAAHLSGWLAENDYSPHLIRKALTQKFMAKEVKARITSGTEFHSVDEWLLEFSLAHSSHTNFIDEL